MYVYRYVHMRAGFLRPVVDLLGARITGSCELGAGIPSWVLCKSNKPLSHLSSSWRLLFTCVCLYAMCVKVPKQARRGHRTPWSWSYWQLGTTWHECWEPNVDPLHEQSMLLTRAMTPASLKPLWGQIKGKTFQFWWEDPGGPPTQMPFLF